MGMLKQGAGNNTIPDWVQAPDPFSMNTMALVEMTNPVTGETWTAPSGGYSVRPNMGMGEVTLNTPADFAPEEGVWGGSPMIPEQGSLGPGWVGGRKPVKIDKGIGQMNNGMIQMTESMAALDGNYGHMFNPETGQITQKLGGRGSSGKAPNIWNVGDEGYQQLMDNYQQNNPNSQSLSVNQSASDFTAGNNQGISNLAYSGSQLAGTTPAGLEKQNLDYALSQLGMMTGGYGNGTGSYTQSNDFGSAANPQAGVTYGGDSAYTTDTAGSSDDYRTPQDYQDYLTGGRSFLQGALGLFGPIGTGLGIATDYDMGFSTLSPNTGDNLGYTNPLTDEYSAFYNKNYAGPGSDMAFTQDLMYPTEQRDMLINQQSFDILPEQTEETFMDWIGGMFGGNTLNYDPDMDLERSGWSDTTPAAPGSFDNRLQGPWSGTDTYNNSLEGYANAEQINKDFNEMNVNWQDELNAAISSNPTEVSDFGKIYGMLGEGIMKDLTSQQANLTGEDLEQVKSLQNYLFDYTSPQDAVEKMGKDTQVKMDVIRNELNVNKELDAKDRKELTDQLNTYNTRFNARLDNDIESSKVEINILRDQLANNNKLTTEARKVFEQQLTARTNKLYNDSLDKVNSLTTQLQDVGVNNTTKYNDLLSKLETIEGDLTQQINDFYTGPNVGTPDTGGTSPEDLGGTSTTDDDAQAEIDSGYDDPSESSGPSAPGSGYTGSDGGGGSFDSGSSGTDDNDASSETGDYSSYDSPDDSSGPSTGGWGW